MFSMHPMELDSCFEFSHWAIFCSLLTSTSFSVAISVFSSSNRNAMEFRFRFRFRFCLQSVTELLLPQIPNVLSSGFLSSYDRSSESSTLPQVPYLSPHCLERCSRLIVRPIAPTGCCWYFQRTQLRSCHC